jgi:hypothetical protein
MVPTSVVDPHWFQCGSGIGYGSQNNEKAKKTYLRRYKSLFEKQEARVVRKFWSIFMFVDPDPDPGKPNECGSMRIRIHNSGSNLEICWPGWRVGGAGGL